MINTKVRLPRIAEEILEIQEKVSKMRTLECKTKLDISTKGNPLDKISDLIEVLDEITTQDYMIAGGFVRDWYQEEPFNDIDIYIFEDPKAFKAKLEQTKRFTFLERTALDFFDCHFHEKGSVFQSGKMKHHVQFILWHSTPSYALKDYDFEHCKFFIPLKRKSNPSFFDTPIDRVPFSFNKRAIESSDNKQLTPSSGTMFFLEGVRNHAYGSPLDRFTLETIVKRIGKFQERGMKLPKEDISSILEAHLSKLENNKQLDLLDHEVAPIQSVLLEDLTRYDQDRSPHPSKYTISEIYENLVKTWIMIKATDDQNSITPFLISPSKTFRVMAKQFLEENK